jgi:hypothetical protein
MATLPDPMPLIQIDDEVREMTPEEYAKYLNETGQTPEPEVTAKAKK